MSTAPDPTAALADRYGGPSAARRRTVIAVSGVVGAVALGWIIWAAWIQGTPHVQSTLRSYEIVDTHTAEATIAVKTRSAETRATCIVRATAADKSVVGEVTFSVTGQGGTSNHQVTLRTEREADAVELKGCTAPGQPKPR